MTPQKKNSLSCHHCPLSSLCLPSNLNHNETTQFDQLIKERRTIERNQHLFRINEPFKQVYIVQSGAVKSYSISMEGDEHVNAFHFPLELIGFDGLADETHQVSAIALEHSVICTLPFEPLLSFASTAPALQRQLFNMISQHMVSVFSISSNSYAETRLATFLLDLSNRLKKRGRSSSDFKLSMSREDIGNYLGLAAETVSRLFHGFEKKGILETNRRTIHLNDFYALRTLSSGS